MATVSSVVRRKCVDVMEDRVNGVYNDLKVFTYIRKNNLQHKEGNLGGGNIVIALTLFSAINFLAKCYYCTVKPKKFDENGQSLDETAAFIAFMKFLQNSGILLNLPSDGETLRLVWNGFRNYLVHRLTVEAGKSVLTYTFETEPDMSVEEIMTANSEHDVFEHDGYSRNWHVNSDALSAKLLSITATTKKHILECGEIDENLLVKVVGIQV